MYWANFLHIYQPPTQTKEILDRVTNESYRKIIAGLLDNPKAKVTLNINGVLTEMLAMHGYQDVLDGIKTLLDRGQMELTASAKYHPLLPKMPDEVIIRQIQHNHDTNRKYFGDLYKPQGFFPPEMAYNQHVGEVIKKLGYKWIILDEMACSVPYDPTKTYKNSDGLNFFFRERGASFKILSAQLGTAQSVIREFGDRIPKNEYLLTAMDGETFGHHRLGLEQLLLEIYQSAELPTVTISELLELFPEFVEVTPRSSTWALMPRDVQKNTPFSRWDDPENPIHGKQWELTDLAIALSQNEKEEEKHLLDQSLHSDQYWWASAKPWWSLEMIERGAFDLLSAIREFKNASDQDKKRAWDLYIEIITLGFDWQRTGRVADLSRKEDEEIKEMMGTDQPWLSKKDYEQMIATLNKQMLAAAHDQEYARAEQFKKRIIELTAAMENLVHDRVTEITVNQ